MKKIIRIVLATIGVVVTALVLFILYFWATEWRPFPIENVMRGDVKSTVIAGDTIKIVSWNIGYAGLGDNMDFFYDGGVKVQDTRERTIENMNEIIAFLKSQSDADFILLQEVDSGSKRNYDINLYNEITGSLTNYIPYYALNYSAPFVPIPVTSPIGNVQSGVLTLSKYGAVSANRYHYPSSFPFPVRLFNLKRCLLVTEFETSSGERLTIGNTHNSAFDDGGMRRDEFNFIKTFVTSHQQFIISGDWNSNPPLYTPTAAEIENKYFSPLQIDSLEFGDNVRFAADLKGQSARYNYQPYQKGITTTTLLDFAITSKNITPLSVEIVDLGFHASDHAPVVFKFLISK